MTRGTSGFRLRDGEQGTMLVVSVLVVGHLAALATGFFAVVQSGSRQSRFFTTFDELRRYAESGARLAVHELNVGTGGGGNLGTESWTTATDFGRDGTQSTGDQGEDDGLPTPGEPNLAGLPLGPSGFGFQLIAWTTDTGWPNIKRAIATAYNDEAGATVEVCSRNQPRNPLALGAAYVEDGSDLKLGGSLVIDGNDWNPDGTRGLEPPVHGISTAIGHSAGSNAEGLILQVPRNATDQVLGLGGQPSIGEVERLDLDALFEEFKPKGRNIVTPGIHTNVVWGDWESNDFRVSYCNGDLALSGGGRGAGVLLVDGSLTLTGRTNFVGLVIVRGDVGLSGSGNSVQVYGSLIATSRNELNFVVTGNPTIRYSSEALSKAFGALGTGYQILAWNYLR